MKIGWRCDVGTVRKLNEDSVACVRLDAHFQKGDESAGLFVVADGMGGHNAGEIASENGIKTFVTEYFSNMFKIDKTADKPDETIKPRRLDQALADAIIKANEVIFKMSESGQGMQGMGTTMTAALISGEDLYVSHVGDSRCYVIHEREAIQITKDHSFVQELVDAGKITADEARVHPQKNVITRVVGYDKVVKVEAYHRKLFQGDNILLCSDGLWGVVPDSKITQLVLFAETPQQACDALIKEANKMGGPDNISVIIVQPERLAFLSGSHVKNP